MAHFSQYISGDFREKYLKIVKNLFSGIDVSYHSYRRDSNASIAISDSLYGLINSANSLIENNEVQEASVICQCLIEVFPEYIEHMDDGDGYILEDVFATFRSLLVKAEEDFKNELFYYCLKEYSKSKYQDFGYDDNFLGCLQELISNNEQYDIFIEMLDTQIQKHKNLGSSYNHIKYLKIKYDFFIENKELEKANLFISKNIAHHEFRIIAINQAMNTEKYSQAKKLCFDGIDIAQEGGKVRSIHDLQDFLLQIAEFEKDKQEICKWSEILFNDSYRDMHYYKKLKSSYPKKEWKAKCESIIDQIKGKNQYGGYGLAEELADIFIEEKYFGRLLVLLQINHSKIILIDKYAHHLTKNHPAEILDLYSKGIKAQAEKTGRPIYNQTVSYMKTISSIPDSQIKIEELIGFFKMKYKNRRAMMEILANSFPNQFINL